MDTTKEILPEARQGEPLVMVSSKKIVPNGKKLYIESYGCQMNFSDSEIVASLMLQDGYITTSELVEADVIFLNTCAIRENAETRIRNKLKEFGILKKQRPHLVIGILGCMAERIKNKLLEEEHLVDIVVGPDAYRDIINLVTVANSGQKAVNVLLSKEETYAEISPVRLSSNGVSAFVSITRGCDNMCAFCVVPFTRGRERSRSPESILNEVQELISNGYKEVTLLGQNVDSYYWTGGGLKKESYSPEEQATAVTFPQLLAQVAETDPTLRVRFSTSHPKDMSDEVLYTVAKYPNICDYVHLPVQSGSSRILEMMNRGYDRNWYLDRIKAIKRIIPHCGISTDIITGFCSETQQDHEDTLRLIQEVQYDFAYMFHYSERPKTLAERKYQDDVPLATKQQRLTEIVALQREFCLTSNQKDIGKVFEVLIEGFSKKSDQELFGRNSQNKGVIFPNTNNYQKGQYVQVKINSCTSGALIGEVVTN